MIDGVASCDLACRLASITPCDGLADLVRRQLGFAAHLDAALDGSLAPLIASRLNQLALKFREPTKRARVVGRTEQKVAGGAPQTPPALEAPGAKEEERQRGLSFARRGPEIGGGNQLGRMRIGSRRLVSRIPGFGARLDRLAERSAELGAALPRACRLSRARPPSKEMGASPPMPTAHTSRYGSRPGSARLCAPWR
jgi:hypothetical protein